MRFYARTATPTHSLHLRNIYILPTRSGMMLCATTLLLLLTSINFQLNLGYAFTFLIFSAALTSAFITYRALKSLTLSTQAIKPVFAMQNMPFTINVDNPEKYTRYGIGIAINEHTLKYEYNKWAWINLPPQDVTPVTFATLPTTRGWMDLPELVIHTRFPMGVFRAWSVWQPLASALVYPAPEENPPPLPANQAGDHVVQQQPNQKHGSEFDGVRPYQIGDPLKQIVWKKMLPNGDLVSRQNTSFTSSDLWLDLQCTRLASTEAQLSRLTAWVIQAHNLGINYGLKLGNNVHISPSRGEDHQRHCLQELALYKHNRNPLEHHQVRG